MDIPKFDLSKHIIPLAIIFVIACFYLVNFFNPKPVRVNLELKWLHQAQFAGYYVADNNNFYANVGLDVDIHQKNSEINNIDEVSEGKSEFAIVSGSDFLKAVYDGRPIIAVAALFQYSPAAIASLKESNIKEPKDFNGKNLGLVSDTQENELLYKSLLKNTNINKDNLTFTSTGFKQVEYLLDKKVDTVALYRISGLNDLDARTKSYNVILPEDYGYKLYDDILITNKNFLDKNEHIVKKFVSASMKGWKEAIKNPEKTTEITLKYINQKKTNSDQQKKMLLQSIPLIKPKNVTIIGSMNDSQWQKQIDLLKEVDLIGYIDPKNIYTNKYLE